MKKDAEHRPTLHLGAQHKSSRTNNRRWEIQSPFTPLRHQINHTESRLDSSLDLKSRV